MPMTSAHTRDMPRRTVDRVNCPICPTGRGKRARSGNIKTAKPERLLLLLLHIFFFPGGYKSTSVVSFRCQFTVNQTEGKPSPQSWLSTRYKVAEFSEFYAEPYNNLVQSVFKLVTLFQICLVALMAVAASARPQAEPLPLDDDGIPFNVSEQDTLTRQLLRISVEIIPMHKKS